MREFNLTDDQLRLLRELAGLGLTLHQMAKCMGCGVSTLQRKYMDEIEEGRIDLSLTLRRKLFKLATEKDNIGALIFLAKTVGGMSDKQVVELNIAPESGLTPEQRNALLGSLIPAKLQDANDEETIH